MSGHGCEKWPNWSKTRDYYSGVGIRTQPNPAWSASPASAEDALLSLPSLMISVVEPFVTVCGERFDLFTDQQTLSSGLLCSQIFTSSVYCGGRAWVKSKVQTFMESGKVKVELKFKREALTSLPF